MSQRVDESGLFLNLSNHPSSQWSNEQREAALALAGPAARIVDLPFPQVDPRRTDLKYLDELIASLPVQEFALRYRHAPKAAMVQGEHVLTVLLVARLLELGFRCYAATSERQTEVQPDGRKVVTFRFVCFRPYPAIRLE